MALILLEAINSIGSQELAHALEMRVHSEDRVEGSSPFCVSVLRLIDQPRVKYFDKFVPDDTGDDFRGGALQSNWSQIGDIGCRLITLGD